MCTADTFFKKREEERKKDNSTFIAVLSIILSLAIIKYKSLLEESFPKCAANIQIRFIGSQDTLLLRSVVRKTFYIQRKDFCLKNFVCQMVVRELCPLLIFKCLSNFKMHI